MNYYEKMTAEHIRADIARKQDEIQRADKRTHNGKMVRTFNNAIMAQAKLLLAEIESEGGAESEIL